MTIRSLAIALVLLTTGAAIANQVAVAEREVRSLGVALVRAEVRSVKSQHDSLAACRRAKAVQR